MTYYPLSTPLFAGIQQILIISTTHDTPSFQELLGDGSRLGLELPYKVQPRTKGVAQAYILWKEFIWHDPVCLVIGDNIFYGHGLTDLLQQEAKTERGVRVFGYYAKEPKQYGVVEFDGEGAVISIEEKTEQLKYNYAVVGLYFYDNEVIAIAENLRPFYRGEFEISDLKREYLKKGKLSVQLMGRGFTWFDTETYESLAEATSYLRAVQDRQSLKSTCIEEIVFHIGFIDKKQLEILAKGLQNSSCVDYMQPFLLEG